MTPNVPTPTSRCRRALKVNCTVFVLILSMILCTWESAFAQKGRTDQPSIALVTGSGQQEGAICYQGTDIDQGSPLHYMKQVQCDQVPSYRITDEWRELPPVKKSWAERHRELVIILPIVGAALAGGTYGWVSRKHCDKYPAGYSGSGVNCPK